MPKIEKKKLWLVLMAAVSEIIFVSYRVFSTLLVVTLTLLAVTLLLYLLLWCWNLLCLYLFGGYSFYLNLSSWNITGLNLFAEFLDSGLLYASLVLTLIILCNTSKPGIGKDNPYRKYHAYHGWIEARIDRFIAWMGTLKYFTSPICIVEDPGSYQIKGHEIRKLIDDTSPDRLLPGDILLRGYDGYLDGKLISLSGGDQGLGKYFSHAAIFLGELTIENDKPIVARRLQVADEKGDWHEASDGRKNAIRNNLEYFQTGRQMVIHSMSKGIFVEDILTFLRCDYLMVLRLDDRIQLGKGDFDNKELVKLEDASPAKVISQRLKDGETVGRDEIIKLVHDSALGKIGSCYDFQFNDIKKPNRFSCSEFVYYCYKSIHCYLGMQPKKHAFMGRFFARVSITPADIYNAAENSNKFIIFWKSDSIT